MSIRRQRIAQTPKGRAYVVYDDSTLRITSIEAVSDDDKAGVRVEYSGSQLGEQTRTLLASERRLEKADFNISELKMEIVDGLINFPARLGLD